jgi:FixJ family two-component response regulator
MPPYDSRNDVRPVVHIVDDDPDMGRLLDFVISREGFRTSVHTGTLHFLNEFERTGCGCLVVDYYLPDMTGLELHDKLRAMGHHVPFIVVTGRGDVSAAVDAMRHGASGFLEKPFSQSALVELVRGAVNHHLEWEAVQRKLDSLSAREREVLTWVASGELTKQIALRLDISPRTVEVHRSHIMKKMGMRSIAQLVHTLTKHDLSDAPA